MSWVRQCLKRVVHVQPSQCRQLPVVLILLFSSFQYGVTSVAGVVAVLASMCLLWWSFNVGKF